MKEKIGEIFLWLLLVVSVTFSVVMIVTTIREGGWYCEYCKLWDGPGNGIHCTDFPCQRVKAISIV